MIRHASFFSGAGGLDLGLAAAGIETVSVSEIEPYACAVLAERLPHAPNLGDITKIDPEAIPDADLWTGGFPCQDLSIAGQRRGFAGARSVLAFSFLDLVERRRPAAIILENVPGLLTSHSGRDLLALTRRLAELGYGWAFRVLDARYFGVPQRRRRVFIVALRSDPGDPDGRTSAERAAAVLAVGYRCRWHPTSGIEARALAAARARDGAALAGAVLAREGRGIGHNYPEDHIVGTLAGPSPNRGWPRLENATDGYLVGPVRAGGHGDPGIGREGDERRLVPARPTAPHAGRDGAADGLAGRLDDRDRLGDPEEGAPLGFSLRGRAEGNVPEPFSGESPAIRGASGGSTQPVVLAPTLRVGAARIEDGGPGDTVPVILSPTLTAPVVREGGRRDRLPVILAPTVLGGARAAGPRTTDLNTQLVAFVKHRRAQTSEEPETWGEGDIAPTLPAFDSGDARATALAASPGAGGEDDPMLPLGLDSHRYRCCGNGVVAPVAEWLGARIAAELERNVLPSRAGSAIV